GRCERGGGSGRLGTSLREVRRKGVSVVKLRRWPLVVAAAVLLVAAAASAALATSQSAGKAPATATFSWGTFKLSPRIAAKLQGKGRLNYVLSIEGTGI